MQYRQSNNYERTVLERLLGPEFPGRDALRDRLRDFVVRPIDEDSSLSILARGDMKASVIRRIPVEGDATDEGGATIHLLLHVVGGKPNELEILREDGSKVVVPVNPASLELFS